MRLVPAQPSCLGQQWLTPDAYNVVAGRRVKARYGFDVLVAAEGSQALEVWIEFFTRVREKPGVRKGILKVVP